MYTGFGGIILDFISSFFLSSLNNSLIPAIIKAQLNIQRLSCIPAQWASCIPTLGLSTALSHSKHICRKYWPCHPRLFCPFPCWYHLGLRNSILSWIPKLWNLTLSWIPKPNLLKRMKRRRQWKFRQIIQMIAQWKTTITTKEHRPIQPNKQTAWKRGRRCVASGRWFS